MARITLGKRTKIVRGKRGSGFATLVYDLPEITIDVPAEADVARYCADRLLAEIKGNLRSGRDLTGTQHSISSATRRTRRYDRQPPLAARGHRAKYRQKRGTWGGPLIASIRRGQRWQERYPSGKGSEGGSTFGLDSGYLADNLSVSISGSSAEVRVPSARVAAVLAIESGRRECGPVPIVGVTDRHLEQTAQAAVNGAIGSFGGGGGAIGAAISGAIGQVGGRALLALLGGVL